MRDRLVDLVGAAVRRPALTAAVVLVLAVGGGLLALSLTPSAATSTFVSSSSSSYRATTDDYQHFGGDAVIVLIREPLPDLVETKDLAIETELEACLAGQVVVANSQLQAFTPAKPGTRSPYGGWSSPCGQLMRTHPVAVVYGPGTFLNRAVAAVNTQLTSMLSAIKNNEALAGAAAYALALRKHMSHRQAVAEASAAKSLVEQQAVTQLGQLYLNSGISGMPRIDDPQFIPQIVFDQTRGVNEPKARFAYLFPTKNSALIQVRLKAGLSQAQQARAISLIRRAVAMPMFRSTYGGTYTVTGEPVVVNDLTAVMSSSIVTLLLAALAVMAITLLLVFRRGLRLLPLVLALLATAITFGLMAIVGETLTLASIAVLPILIGLAVDYAIQFQSRIDEARHTRSSVAAAVLYAARAGAPTIGVAALATGTGFLVLLLSPVPMVRGFGLMLVVGIAVAFVCTLSAGSAAIALADRGGGPLGASLRGAAELLGDLRRPLRRLRARAGARDPFGRRARTTAMVSTLPQRALRAVAARPHRVLALAAVVALVGWVADTQTAVQSDVTKLVPASMPALRDLNTLEKATGVSGEIDVTVRARNVATPQTVAWMTGYEQRLLAHFGYLEERGCTAATLCPALSLPDLFSSGDASGAAPKLSQSSINSLLGAVPSYFSQAVITPDHREAALAFGIRLMPLSRQEKVVDYMRSQLHPPPGVTAQLAGLSVLAAQANSALASSARRLLTLLAGLLAVGLVLLAVFRRPERAIIPLVPIALATGWSALILYLIGIPLNPMSASMGALVIAISTEFSVLLSERFRQERLSGREVGEAIAETYRSTGAAVLASGLTAIAGFGILVVSNITMLRDFGFVTLVDLTVSLLGVLLVLPAVIMAAERRQSSARVRARRSPPVRLRVRRRATLA